MIYGVIFIFGFILGAVIVSYITGKSHATQLTHLKDSFKALSSDVFSKNAQDFLAMANEVLSKYTKTGENTLESKKQLIDQTLGNMKDDLVKVGDLMKTLEKDRENKFGAIDAQIKTSIEENRRLRETTNKLQSVLVNNKIRGDWGERMAEDVLRLAGFVEGVNYLKQKKMEAGGKKPDFTFLLPQNLIVNMDVKFPLNNYLKYYAAENDIEKNGYKDQFLKDVKNRIKEVLERNYINPEDNTVDYVIVFIPNEQVYSFINQEDPTIVDEALKNKVIFCSPLTLYAILAVIRQAMDNFKLEKTASEILSLLGAFNKNWEQYVESMEVMGDKIEAAQKEYQRLINKKRKDLESPLAKIENLRVSKGIPIAAEENGTKELTE